jgi:hypothetical protein
MSDIQTIEKPKQGEKPTAKGVRVQPIIRLGGSEVNG